MSAQQGPTGHVVVCGVRGVGLRTVEQLHASGIDVVVVADGPDSDPLTDRLLAGWGVPRIAGRPKEALVEAGIAGATAVVCVPDDDLRAMEIALLVRRLRPDVRLVVRMGNSAVGRALAEVIGEGSVLDVAALASPSVVEACLDSRPHPIELAGQGFVAAQLIAPRDATLRELYGPLAPIAVAGQVPGPVPGPAGGAAAGPEGAPAGGPAGGAEPPAEPVICPGRDHPVRAGDRVTAIGTLEQFAAHGGGDVLARLRPSAPLRYGGGARGAGAARAVEQEDRGGRAGLRVLVRSLAAESDRPLRTTLLVLGVLFAVSVLVLRLGYVKPDGSSMTVLDATYFTVETIGTVGYGDFSFAEQAPWLRVYAIALMVFGVVLAAIWFALLTQLLVSSRIERSFGQRRVGAMKGHVIVVGLGAVGVRVLEGLLAAGRQVVVLERDENNRFLPRARQLGVPVVAGDATDATVLGEVNLGSAAAIAVLTSSDLVNIETGLVVRDQLGDRWASVPVVLRVFDRELGETVGAGFDFRYVRSTAALAAPWFVGAALGLDVLGTFYVDRTPFMVGRLAVAPRGGLDGLAMGELSARTRVVAIHRAAGADGVRTVEYPPRSGTRFGAGDDAYLVGPYEELLAVLRRDALAPGDATPAGAAAGSGDAPAPGAAAEPTRPGRPARYR
ncbi:MAG TPA: NAD-binding protein [Pseudonocardia sp.]|jgi:Trk K+ transport system NAD-binding subunit|nr:NAD-binding protein [Pseudonocardia sp.]